MFLIQIWEGESQLTAYLMDFGVSILQNVLLQNNYCCKDVISLMFDVTKQE